MKLDKNLSLQLKKNAKTFSANKLACERCPMDQYSGYSNSEFFYFFIFL